MRKNVFGRQFKRDTRQRKALFRSLMREMILNGQIKTTEAKAKAIKGELEKHVTKAKVKKEGALVHLQRDFQQDVALRLIRDIAPKFADRPGGYTRIIRLGTRLKDNAPVVMMEWVEKIEKFPEPSKKRAEKKPSKKSSKVNQSEAKTSDTKETKKKVSKKTPTKKTTKKAEKVNKKNEEKK